MSIKSIPDSSTGKYPTEQNRQIKQTSRYSWLKIATGALLVTTAGLVSAVVNARFHPACIAWNQAFSEVRSMEYSVQAAKENFKIRAISNCVYEFAKRHPYAPKDDIVNFCSNLKRPNLPLDSIPPLWNDINTDYCDEMLIELYLVTPTKLSCYAKKIKFQSAYLDKARKRLRKIESKKPIFCT